MGGRPGSLKVLLTTLSQSAGELMQICKAMLGGDQLKLEEEAENELVTLFEKMEQVDDKENGNGRAVRNVLEAAKRSQALRLQVLLPTPNHRPVHPVANPVANPAKQLSHPILAHPILETSLPPPTIRPAGPRGPPVGVATDRFQPPPTDSVS